MSGDHILTLARANALAPEESADAGDRHEDHLHERLQADHDHPQRDQAGEADQEPEQHEGRDLQPEREIPCRIE